VTDVVRTVVVDAFWMVWLYGVYFLLCFVWIGGKQLITNRIQARRNRASGKGQA